MLGRRRTARGATHQEESSSLALSFLDLMSAGFGGGLLLFVILATLPVEEPRDGGGGGSGFIDVWFEWMPFSDETAAKVEGLIDLSIRHRAAGSENWLNFRLSSADASIRPATDEFRFGEGGEPRWDSVTVVGYDRGGDYAAVDVGDGRYLHVRISEPQAGEWSLFGWVSRYRDVEAPHGVANPRERAFEVKGEWQCSGEDGHGQLELTLSGDPHEEARELFTCSIAVDAER